MVKILHAADLHLDAAFSSLSPEEAARRRQQQRTVPDMLADLCEERGCHMLLLAGDVFDGEAVCPETVEALQGAFARCSVPIFIAPGNHDPYTAHSPWVTAKWPENVHIFTDSMDCVTLPDLGCRIWGGAFRSREAYALLRPVPPAEDGFLEVGVFHGDPVNDGTYHPISAHALRTCGLDYLALGHIHARRDPAPMEGTLCGWPGAAMGRGFDECGEKGVLYVELEKDGCRSEFVPLPMPRYEIFTCEAESLQIPESLYGTVCRLVLTGESDPVDTEKLQDALSPRFLQLEVRDRTVPKRDLWADAGDGTLRGTALARLKQQYDAGNDTAALAARYVLAALEGREEP